MSLGYSNIAFPNETELDKIEEYYQASYHYNNAPTASLSVSQSYSTSVATQGGTATGAVANNGNIAICFENTTTMTIIEGIGGAETQVALPGGGDTWRGMVYNPPTDEFVLFADRIVFVNATTFATRSGTSALGSSQVWGGCVVNGKIYYGPYTGNTTQIAELDVESGVSIKIGPTFSGRGNFLSPCITKDGVVLWGGEGDSIIKEYDILNDTYNEISTGVIAYGGYQAWAPLADGRLFNPGWNSSNYNLYYPASINNGTSEVKSFSKGTSNSGPWSNVILGLDGNAYYVDSKGVNQLGGVYSNIWGFDATDNIWFQTQFKMPAASTGGDRQNQCIIGLPDGNVFTAGSREGQYHVVKMFEPNNSISTASRTAGFTPNTSN